MRRQAYQVERRPIEVHTSALDTATSERGAGLPEKVGEAGEVGADALSPETALVQVASVGVRWVRSAALASRMN